VKKKVYLIILIVIIQLITLSSCIKGKNSSINNGDISDSTNEKAVTASTKDKIQLWYYTNSQGYNNDILEIVESAKQFCKNNNIVLEVFGYNDEILKLEEYILKRNIALASDNVIIIDPIQYMRDVAKQHGDYSRIENYNNLLNSYKNRFCIPLELEYFTCYIENDAVQYYGINIEKPLILYTDYLKIKQDMKEKGARFELNGREFFELTDCYLDKNDLLFLDEESDILKNNDMFKETLKKTIISICDDILLNYDIILDIDTISLKPSALTEHIEDNNSGLTLMGDALNMVHSLINSDAYQNVEDVSSKTFYIYPFSGNASRSFYMSKNITNDKVYDLANYIISEDFYIKTFGKSPWNMPAFKPNKAKSFLSIDENFEFVGFNGYSPKVKEIINLAYEMVIKNDSKSMEIADAYFANGDYNTIITFFIKDIIKDIAYELSGDLMSLEKFNSQDKYINEIIDKEINDFVINFRLHYN
jgi:hypothetical protein